jgi:hypothetical protein
MPKRTLSSPRAVSPTHEGLLGQPHGARHLNDTPRSSNCVATRLLGIVPFAPRTDRPHL